MNKIKKVKFVSDFEYTYKKLKSEDIEIFENDLGIMLPVAYKNFLEKNNGGKAKKRRFNTNDGSITSSVMLFFPISDETELNLKASYQKYNLGEIVPSNLLPIGIDPADSLICLELGENSKVFFCDLDYYEEDGELRPEYINLVAEDFLVFLDNLYES